MDIPKPLRIVSIVLIVMGVLRMLGGVLSLMQLEDYSENEHRLTEILVGTLVFGFFIALSGFLLYKGFAVGRILLSIAVVVSLSIVAVLTKDFSFSGIIIFLIIIAILFFNESIKEYFEKK